VLPGAAADAADDGDGGSSGEVEIEILDGSPPPTAAD
jgi:hypothetical protein